MSTNRPVARALFVAVPLSLFVGFGAGLVSSRCLAPDPAAGQTDLGRRVVAALDGRPDWTPTGQRLDGLMLMPRRMPERSAPPGEDPDQSQMTVRPDYDHPGRAWVRVNGLNVSDDLSPADHAAVLAALSRRRLALADRAPPPAE